MTLNRPLVCMKTGLLIFALLVGLVLPTIATAAEKSTYNGRVIDKETKLGIEGAAVVAVWR